MTHVDKSHLLFIVVALFILVLILLFRPVPQKDKTLPKDGKPEDHDNP
jgi:hypothetical protein